MNYPVIEKLVLALVYAARRLRRYFQGHQIEVLTNSPIKQILLKPETSGRLEEWAIELGEHDITYHPRASIKEQALADFLLEVPRELQQEATKAHNQVCSEKEANQRWTLHTDGASNKEGSSAGLILTSPIREEITYALRFDFHMSNNEAEYETLLADLRLVVTMGAERVTAMTDSRLAANQVSREFETKDKRMEKYVKAVQQITSTLKSFEIKLLE
uniref:RNase H type-1 domain-containing protein n=1 Tax=Lactuca sativa TaxID=4236 RepID=A0A9R1XN85_LACSA|nr:hypothetical protein LSAT_V11C300156660 [Lactuca sativa]